MITGASVVDHTNRLGFAKMPEGYYLLQLDSGHFMWRHDSTDLESCIHWNKWVVHKGAWEDSRSKK